MHTRKQKEEFPSLDSVKESSKKNDRADVLKGVFLEDAVNALIPEHYSKALAECELEIVSQPTIDITQAEPGKAFIFTAEVAVKPEVTLGDYKGVEVPKTEITVTDEDVEAELKKEQEKNSRTISVEDRAAQLNDIVTIDFEGWCRRSTFRWRTGYRVSSDTWFQHIYPGI